MQLHRDKYPEKLEMFASAKEIKKKRGTARF